MPLPPAFEEQMQGQLGPDYPRFRESLEQDAVISLRINAKKARPLPFPAESVPWHPRGRYLKERPAFALDPLYHAGAYYVQEASSMFLFEALRQWLPAGKGLRALDLAAAPGGKTTLLADALPADTLLLANEVIRSRYAVLRENVARWGAHIHTANHDPADFAGLHGFFDLVLVDAPCSGEGLFRKDPDATQHWSAEQVAHCSRRQRRILNDAAPLLRRGGLLLYSTCTYNAHENEGQLQWLSDHLGMEPLALNLPPGWGVVPRGGGYQFYPHRLRGEGYFLAGLRATRDLACPVPGKGRFRRLKPVGRKVGQATAPWLAGPEDRLILETPNGGLRYLPADQADSAAELEAALPRLALGRALGQFKGKAFIPAHDLALANDRAASPDDIELDSGEALRFLRREPLADRQMARGWHCVTFQGLGLGWMKGLGRRNNNYLPPSWRLRQ